MANTNTEALDLASLRKAVAGNAAAFRCLTEYEPAGGPGDKVFPPTYEGGKYAFETRRINGEAVPCVLLDSVQSQANRMELALLQAWEKGDISLPVIVVDFRDGKLFKPLRVTSLDAPHRIADAILRDSEVEEKGKKVRFRDSAKGKALDYVDIRNARPLFELCPTALVFGMWDSTGPRGGLGAKFQRAVVSEIVGLHAEAGVRTSSRIDPLQIMLQAGPIYAAPEGDWTLDENAARKVKGKPAKVGKEGKPSELNHGNVTPSIAAGGFTIGKAIQTTVISLPALRRLRFPANGETKPEEKTDTAARTVLAALGLCAAALARLDTDLRSRCLLTPTGPVEWELLGEPGETPKRYALSPSTAIEIFRQAVEEAKKAGLPWMEEPLELKPSDSLLALVRRSQELQVSQAIAEEE
ncbi:MAG TPA: type I-U CRISPR-associated RAMP protein Csb1/Cas7u [Hyphomicrobiaceae bacterium]